MKTKRITLVAMLFVLLALITGCAGNGVGEDTTDMVTTVTEPPVTEPPEVKPKPVFIDGMNGKDENSGLAADAPVATYERAFELLDAESGVLVIMDTVVTDADYELPEYDGILTITSLYDGIDYTSENNSALRVGAGLTLSCDTVLDNIALKPSSTVSRIFCNFHSLTVKETVSCTVTASRGIAIYGGYSVPDLAMNADGHLTAKQVSYEGDCTLTVLGGSWRAVVGGNLRDGRNSPVGTFEGNMKVLLGGSAEFDSLAPADDIYAPCVAAGGSNFYIGTLTLEISGGSFASPVYGVTYLGNYYNYTAANGKTGTNGLAVGKKVEYTAALTIKISGGKFDASVTRIGAAQVPGETAFNADFLLDITGGEFDPAISFSALGVLGERGVTGLPAGAATADFSTVNGTATGEARALRVACVGDSITFGVGTRETVVNGYAYRPENFSYPTRLQQLYGDNAVIGNFGYPGSNVTSTAYCKFQGSCCWNMLMCFDPDIIVIALGTNNASLMPGGLSDFKNAFSTMLSELHKKFPEARIINTTALYRWDKPERTESVDKYIIPAQTAVTGALDYVELMDLNKLFRVYGSTSYYIDKLHPNNAGYVKLAETIYKELTK